MKKHDYLVCDDNYIWGTFRATSEQKAKDLCAVQIGYLDESDMQLKEGKSSRLRAMCWKHGMKHMAVTI